MRIVDLNDCKYSIKNGSYLGASGSKDGIIYNDKEWLVKYPLNIRGYDRTGGASYSTSPLSEYIGSHIYEILGYDVHETILGERNNKIVVACCDFTNGGNLLTIRAIKNFQNPVLSEMLERDIGSTGSRHIVNLEELLLHIKYNDILKNIHGIEERFWEQAIIDIFINNNDRNNGNWGILRNNKGEDSLAPIYDNGACMQNKISESKIESLLKTPKVIIENATNIQTAYGTESKLYSADKFLNLYVTEKGLRAASLKVIPIIRDNIEKIHCFIDNIPVDYVGRNNQSYLICSENRKAMFHMQLQSRLDRLLLPHFEKVKKFYCDREQIRDNLTLHL